MIYRLNDDLQFGKFIEKVQKLIERVKNKETVTVELVEKKPQRTLSQNAYLHVLLAFFACEQSNPQDVILIRNKMLYRIARHFIIHLTNVIE